MSEKEKVDKAVELYNQGKYKEAIDAFSSVLETCQDNAELYNNIALCYANLGEYDKANSLYVDALKISERSNYSIYSYAIFCAKRNILGLSANLAEELVGTSAKTLEFKAQIYEQMALTLENLKSYEAARYSFEK